MSTTPDPAWWDTVARHRGTVSGQPNYSRPLPSRLQPDREFALHRYPSGEICLWWRAKESRDPWHPGRAASAEDIAAFRRRGL